MKFTETPYISYTRRIFVFTIEKNDIEYNGTMIIEYDDNDDFLEESIERSGEYKNGEYTETEPNIDDDEYEQIQQEVYKIAGKR